MKVANKLIHGGQYTFAIDPYSTVNQWRRCTGPTNKLRNIPGVLRNIQSVLHNVPGELHIHPSQPRVSGNDPFLTS